MGDTRTKNQLSTFFEQWCLVTVQQGKREIFLKYLDKDIQRYQLRELMPRIEVPKESLYQNNTLIEIQDYSEARNYLQKIEHFQSIERIKPEDVARMLNS